jgi:hypothetical protein
VQPTPVPAKLAGACAKSNIYLWRVPQQNESWYVYPRWSIIYVGYCARLSILRFGSRFTKNPVSALQKWKKALFMGWNEISLHGIPRHPKGHARVQYGLVATNYGMIRAEPSSFDLKVMQPRMW